MAEKEKTPAATLALPPIDVEHPLAGRKVTLGFVDGTVRVGLYLSEDKDRIYLTTNQELWFAYTRNVKYLIAGKTEPDNVIANYLEAEKATRAAISREANRIRYGQPAAAPAQGATP